MIGWVWIAVGFLGPIVNLPSVSVFPGIIILFVARVIRKQGEQQTRPREESAEQAEDQVTPRPLNTQRSRPRLEPKKARQPSPAARTGPRAEPTTEPGPVPSSRDAGPPADEREELLERVLLVGQELTDEPPEPLYPEQISDDDEGSPLSSAEMIARAHRRWDRKP